MSHISKRIAHVVVGRFEFCVGIKKTAQFQKLWDFMPITASLQKSEKQKQ
jgi:hypothetical protein